MFERKREKEEISKCHEVITTDNERLDPLLSAFFPFQFVSNEKKSYDLNVETISNVHMNIVQAPQI